MSRHSAARRQALRMPSNSSAVCSLIAPRTGRSSSIRSPLVIIQSSRGPPKLRACRSY